MVDDALDIPAVAAAQVLGIGLFRRGGRTVVLRIAVGEAVGHQQIDGVGGAEGLAPGRAFAALEQLVVKVELPAVRGDQVESIDTGLGQVGNPDVHEEIVGIVGRGHFGDRNAFHRSVRRDLRIVDIAAMEHQLQVGMHPHPPAGRFDAVQRFGAKGRRAEHSQAEKQELISHFRTRFRHSRRSSRPR